MYDQLNIKTHSYRNRLWSIESSSYRMSYTTPCFSKNSPGSLNKEFKTDCESIHCKKNNQRLRTQILNRSLNFICITNCNPASTLHSLYLLLPCRAVLCSTCNLSLLHSAFKTTQFNVNLRQSLDSVESYWKQQTQLNSLFYSKQ